jgi:hypothetical protein
MALSIERREGSMAEEKKPEDKKVEELASSKRKYTADIEKLEKELQNFEREWEKDKKKGQSNLDKIEKHIDEKTKKE